MYASTMRGCFAFAAALALALATAAARAETLAPADARAPAFAAATRERAPVRVWHAEVERDEHLSSKERRREPQKSVGYRGLVLPGGGRALVAFFAREAVDADAPAVPGSEALYYRALDAEGRPGARIAIARGPDFDMLLDRGGGTSAVLGRWREGTVPLFSIAADGAAREIALKLPYKPLRYETHGTGFLVWFDRKLPNEDAPGAKRAPFHLLKLDAEGRAQWSFEYPRGQYGFVAAAARADGFTLAVLNEGPLKGGIVQDVAALLLDRAGRRVAKHRLDLRGNGGPVPTGLHALNGGGFLLTGFWWGPGGNFVAWLGRDGRLLRYESVTLGDFVEYQFVQPLGDEGFLATNPKGALLRFDRTGKLLWRGTRAPRPKGPEGREERDLSVYDLRVISGNELLLAGARSWSEKVGDEYLSATSVFVERYRWE